MGGGEGRDVPLNPVYDSFEYVRKCSGFVSEFSRVFFFEFQYSIFTIKFWENRIYFRKFILRHAIDKFMKTD